MLLGCRRDVFGGNGGRAHATGVVMRKHFVDGTVAHPRERLTLVALVSALVLGLLVAMAAYRPAMAVERTTLTCHDAVNGDLTCTETTLQELINANAALDAPPPIRIELGAGDTLLTRTLVIPANVDVEFVNYPDQAGVATQSSLVRSGFTGSLISVAGALTISQNGAGSVAIDGRGGHWRTGVGDRLAHPQCRRDHGGAQHRGQQRCRDGEWCDGVVRHERRRDP